MGMMGGCREVWKVCVGQIFVWSKYLEANVE